MEQERPSTPEKQLLKLIEDPKEQDLSQKKIQRRSFSLFSFAALRGRLSFLVENIRSGLLLKKIFLDIKGLNMVLKTCIVLLLLYLIGNFSMSFMRLKETPEFVTRRSEPNFEMQIAGFSSKKPAYYLEGPRSRNIFQFGDTVEEVEEQIIEEVAAPVDVQESEAAVLANQLGLVGIGWSDDPDAMVENVSTGKMYFLKRGQRIEGLIKVDAIFEDRVVLTYGDGQEMELR